MRYFKCCSDCNILVSVLQLEVPLWPASCVYVGQAICYSHSQWADGRMKIFGFALQQLIRHAQTPRDEWRTTKGRRWWRRRLVVGQLGGNWTALLCTEQKTNWLGKLLNIKIDIKPYFFFSVFFAIASPGVCFTVQSLFAGFSTWFSFILFGFSAFLAECFLCLNLKLNYLSECVCVCKWYEGGTTHSPQIV